MNYTRCYYQDLEACQRDVPRLERLRGKTVLLTGAGGMICSAIADFLMYLNAASDYKMRIMLAGRSKQRITDRFSDFTEGKDFCFLEYDSTKPFVLEEDVDYVIHGASSANPSLYSTNPVEIMTSNFVGLANLLNDAVHKTTRVLYISSSEVYGEKKSVEEYREDEYGFVDILNVRSCYPSVKRASETLCVAYGREFGVDAVIVRPGHIYGPTMMEGDTKASSEFSRKAAGREHIVMKSAGNQLRSYCYTADCATAILAVLLNGKSLNAYNVSNPNSICTVREIAECFAKTGGSQIVFENPSDAEKANFNHMSSSALNSEKLCALGWKGRFDLKTGVAHTISILRGE